MPRSLWTFKDNYRVRALDASVNSKKKKSEVSSGDYGSRLEILISLVTADGGEVLS